MEPTQQPDRETCQAILVRRKEMDLFLVITSAGYCLPSVEIPRRQRLCENLTAAMKKRWGCEVICLFRLNSTSAGGERRETRYEVMGLWYEAERQDMRSVWMPLKSLSRESFAYASDYMAVQEVVLRCELKEDDLASGPFVTIGWFERLCEWVEDALHPLKLQLNGSFRQMNASPSFSLIRFETNGPAVWFKAVGPPNLREFPVTLCLVQHFPKYVTPILATRPEWNAWLAPEARGINLRDTRNMQLWRSAATSLACLQIDSIGKHTPLLDSGARNLSLLALSETLQPFLDIIGQLMQEQAAALPAPLTREEILSLGEQIGDALSIFCELGMPQTLGHLDPNPGNVIVSLDRCTFLDWAEAYVGPPFFSFGYFLEHFHRSFGPDSTLETQLTAAYARPWEKLFPQSVISTALAVSPTLAVFAYAAATDVSVDPEDRHNALGAGYIRGLARRMKREADRLANWRLTCLG